MLLYEQPLSSYAQKIKIALREKGGPFDRELPDRRREYRDHRLKWMVKSGGIDVVLAGLRAAGKACRLNP